MLHVQRRHAVPDAPGASTLPTGLTVTHVVDGGVAYLLVAAEGPGEPMTLLLPTASTGPSGLTVFSRLGRVHARHWALVWGQGAPPKTGVDFSSGDLRFRREHHSPTSLVGPAWVATAEGVFRQATVDPDGPSPRWLPLTPSW